MSNYEAIREVLNRMSGQHNVFTVPKIYVEFTGDLTTAVLLNQIVFLSDKSKRTDGYFYKTYKEWQEEICLSERQVRHSVKKLKEMEVVETAIKKANGSPTVHYKLHYDKLVESILTLCQKPNKQNVSIQHDNMSESLTETTTKTTTEKIPYAEIVKYLNEKAGKKFKHTAGQTQKLIKARWNEGNRFEEFKYVIDVCVYKWSGERFSNGVKGDQYLKPSTLFNGKFDERLNWEMGSENKKDAKPDVEIDDELGEAFT